MNITPEDQQAIDGNVEVLGEHFIAAAQDPRWAQKYSLVAMAHLYAETIAAGAPDRNTALKNLAIFMNQLRIIVSSRFPETRPNPQIMTSSPERPKEPGAIQRNMDILMEALWTAAEEPDWNPKGGHSALGMVAGHVMAEVAPDEETLKAMLAGFQEKVVYSAGESFRQ